MTPALVDESPPVTILNVWHTTIYRYSRPVRLGDHRLMIASAGQPRPSPHSNQFEFLTAGIGALDTRRVSAIRLPSHRSAAPNASVPGWVGSANKDKLVAIERERRAAAPDLRPSQPVPHTRVWLTADVLNGVQPRRAGARWMLWRLKIVKEFTQETTLAASEEFDNRREALASALSLLNDRERRIFEARRLAESPITLNELAYEFSVSRERVRQIEVSSFEKVQKSVKNRVAVMETPAPLPAH
jgi:RNA polymerase sigma factor (sigma-70 family)